MASSASSVPPLPATITSTLTSITTTIHLVNSPPADPSLPASPTYTSIPLYSFLADLANLTKAHATKLGLLTNPPIAESSHSAISRILLDVTNSILPVASSAPYIASKERYGVITHAAVVKGVVDVLRGFEEMLKGIEISISGGSMDDKEMVDNGKKGKKHNITDLRQSSTSAAPKSPYTSTGQIWSSADTLLSISQKHLIGLVESKLQSHADMLKDCIAEFLEWVVDAAEEMNDADSGFDEDESQSGSNHADSLDDDFFAEGAGKANITKETLAIAEATQKKLKLISILYTAVMKRRIRDPASRLGGTFSTKVSAEEKEITVEKEKNEDRLQTLVETSKRLVEKADDLAAAFYDGEEMGAIMGLREEVVQCAFNIAEVCKFDREGVEDPVSAWFGKFMENIRA